MWAGGPSPRFRTHRSIMPTSRKNCTVTKVAVVVPTTIHKRWRSGTTAATLFQDTDRTSAGRNRFSSRLERSTAKSDRLLPRLKEFCDDILQRHVLDGYVGNGAGAENLL